MLLFYSLSDCAILYYHPLSLSSVWLYTRVLFFFYADSILFPWLWLFYIRIWILRPFVLFFFLFFFPQHYLPQLLFEIKQCLIIIIINIWYSYRWLFLSPSFFFLLFCSVSMRSVLFLSGHFFFLSKRIKDTIFSIGWNDRGKLVKIMRAWICGDILRLDVLFLVVSIQTFFSLI